MVKDVQRLLRQLTGDDLDKTYRASNKADVAKNPLYLVLTKEELEKVGILSPEFCKDSKKSGEFSHLS